MPGLGIVSASSTNNKKSKVIILSSDAVSRPLRKGLQHVKPILGILWVVEEALGAVGERLSPVSFVMISSPMPDGDHGLGSAVSLSVTWNR